MMRLQLKILFEVKALPILKKNLKNLFGDGGGMHPLAHRKVNCRSFFSVHLNLFELCWPFLFQNLENAEVNLRNVKASKF